MKKNRKLKFYGWIIPHNKTLLTMKLIVLLLAINLMQITASVYSQNTSFKVENTKLTLQEAIKAIESQTDYRVAYSATFVDQQTYVEFKQKETSVVSFLESLTKEIGIGYLLLENDVIVLTSKESKFSNQEITVKGTVTDLNGTPLPGVNIVEKGTSNGTVTDINGNYSISVSSAETVLSFSYIGFLTEEMDVNGQSTINISLVEDIQSLEEVVVVGYGTMAKSQVTASISTIQGEDMAERTSAFNIMESMAGKVAGVKNISFSGKPGGASSIRIRGMGSINADSNPIYVLDGVVGVDPSVINASNVESIDILKDAAATAMYGAKGSNGVVIITTKKGQKGKGTVTYNGKYGVGILNRKIDVLNAEEFMEVQKRAYAYSGKVMPHLQTPMENLFYYSKDASGNYMRDDNGYLIASPIYDTDWQDAITQNAITNDHTLSLSSGSEKTSVYASVAYQDFDGLVKDTYSKRYSGVVNLQSEINDWLNLQAVVTAGSQKRNDMEGGFGQGPIRNMLEMPPIVPVKYEDGTWGRKNDYPLGEAAENPILLLKNQKKIWDENFMVFNLISTIDITDNLKFTAKGDLQTTNKKNMNYAKAGLLDVSENNNGYADIYNETARRLSNENYFTYSNQFFNDRLQSSFVLGASWYFYQMENSSGGSEDFFDYFEYYNLGAGTTYHQPTSGYDKNTMNSYYFRMSQSFDEKYLFGFTFRADGASNFGDNNKYGYFPSASAAWRISEENFFTPVRPVVSNMKLRVSYGAVGNASIPNYRTISSYSNNSMVFNKELQPYVLLNNLGNEDLKWETSKQLNVGIDLGFYDNRFEVLMDYYNKSTVDLLFSKQVPFITGYSNTWTNLGEIVNKGFELTLTSRNVVQSNFSWTTNFIFSTNKIVVEDIGGETIDTGNGTVAKEGEEWASYFVLNRLGTWGLDEIDEAVKYGKKPGDLKYEDVNGDYVIDDNDRKIMGNGLPDGDMNMINTFSFKGLSLMVDLNYSYGAKIMGITTTMMENRQLFGNSNASVLDAWTPENQNSMIAAIRLPSDVNFGENEKDSRMLYNGDFLRIRNIALTYDFDSNLLAKIKFIKGMGLGVNIENAHVFGSFPGFDPELGAFNTDTGQSIEFYSYPRPTTVSANINITF